MASTPTHHYYRLEISGDHTGSSYRYTSKIAGTLAEIKKSILDETSDAQGLSFLVCQDCTFQLELYEDGRPRGVWNLYPALGLRVKKKTLAFLADGRIDGIEEEDRGMLLEDPVLGPILEGEVEPKPVLDLSVLDLPTPRGKPLPPGTEASYERDGRTETQPYGMVSDWADSAHRPRKKKARPSAAPAKGAKKSTKTATSKPAKAAAKKPARATAQRPAKATARMPARKAATKSPTAKAASRKPTAKAAPTKAAAKKPAVRKPAATKVAATRPEKAVARRGAAKKPARKAAAKR